MEENTVKPIIKKLSVILTREPLVWQKYEDQQLQQHRNDCWAPIKSVDKKQKSGLIPSCGQKKKISVEELKNRHNMPYKECKVYLERLDMNTLKQIPNAVYCNNKLVAIDKNVNNDFEINFGKHLVSEKLPVYKQVTADKFKDNDDLYEFDEVDSENTQIVSKAKPNKKKKVKSLKKISKMNKKKHKTNKTKMCNTYNATVQHILQKIMKKVTDGQLKNNEPTPIQNSTPHEPYKNYSIQLHDLSNADNVGDCNNDEIEMGANSLRKIKENETVCDQSARNNNSEMVCFFYRAPVSGNKKIHVISDITLDQSDDWFFNDDLQPDANSTVLLNKEHSPPWRFNDNVKRNPHYLSIKKTGLPCLQQDMVIDHTQAEKIERRFDKTHRKPKKCVNKFTAVEESGLFHDTADKENVSHSVLFHTENFMVHQPKINRHRNILGPKVQNEINIMNVQKNNVVEIPASVNKVTKLSNALDKNLDTSQNSSKESVNNNFIGKLFEDEEPVINFDENSKIYIPKIRKKKKLYDNIEDSNQDKHKREMTKKEEAELEQWAAKFNSQCKDIENYKLDIE